MGTKGRDACLWLFFSLAFACVLAKGPARYVVLTAMLCAAALILRYYSWYLPRNISKGRDIGLIMVVLLPVAPSWARILLRLDGERMEYFSDAYEVHIRSGKQSLGGYLQKLASDLEIVAVSFPGALFMWETSAPLPLSIRRMIRQGSPGTAFLKKGGWPIPRFPLTERDLKQGRVKHGAILNQKEVVS